MIETHVNSLPMAKEYGFRFCCEEGFRDAKWYLGFAEARVKEIEAWSRLFALFALFAIALLNFFKKRSNRLDRYGHLFDPILEVRARPYYLTSQFQAEFASN